MRLPHFDRSDFVFTKALLILVAVGVPTFSVGASLLTWLRGGSLRWELDGLGTTTAPDRLVPGQGVSLSGSDTVVVAIDEAGAAPWLASLLPDALISLAIVLSVVWLLRLVSSIEQGHPFVRASTTALRLVGGTLLAAPLVIGLGTWFADVMISEHALPDTALWMPLNVNFLPVIAGLLVLALGEAFAQGVKLQEDVEGLV